MLLSINMFKCFIKLHAIQCHIQIFVNSILIEIVIIQEHEKKNLIKSLNYILFVYVFNC